MKRGGGEMEVNWPILPLRSWIKVLMETGGSEFLLAGHQVSEDAEYQQIFATFWSRYRTFDGEHAIYSKPEAARAMTIPVCVHGDEGRGLGKIPVLVESYQPLLSWLGEDVVNTLGFLGKPNY